MHRSNPQRHPAAPHAAHHLPGHAPRPARTNPAPRWQRRLLDWPLLLLLATGLGWIALHYSIGAGTEDGLPHPVEPWLMKLHGLAGFAALVALGSFLPLHVPRGWRGGRRRMSAVLLFAGWSLAIGSAWVLYYAAPEDLRGAIGLAHAGVGATFGAILLMHRRLSAVNASRPSGK